VTIGGAILWYIGIAAWWTAALTAMSVVAERVVSSYNVPLKNHVREVARWGYLWPITMPIAGIVVPALAGFWAASTLSRR
jgi:hypothetical protein